MVLLMSACLLNAAPAGAQPSVIVHAAGPKVQAWGVQDDDSVALLGEYALDAAVHAHVWSPGGQLYVLSKAGALWRLTPGEPGKVRYRMPSKRAWAVRPKSLCRRLNGTYSEGQCLAPDGEHSGMDFGFFKTIPTEYARLVPRDSGGVLYGDCLWEVGHHEDGYQCAEWRYWRLGEKRSERASTPGKKAARTLVRPSPRALQGHEVVAQPKARHLARCRATRQSPWKQVGELASLDGMDCLREGDDTCKAHDVDLVELGGAKAHYLALVTLLVEGYETVKEPHGYLLQGCDARPLTYVGETIVGPGGLWAHKTKPEYVEPDQWALRRYGRHIRTFSSGQIFIAPDRPATANKPATPKPQGYEAKARAVLKAVHRTFKGEGDSRWVDAQAWRRYVQSVLDAGGAGHELTIVFGWESPAQDEDQVEQSSRTPCKSYPEFTCYSILREPHFKAYSTHTRSGLADFLSVTRKWSEHGTGFNDELEVACHGRKCQLSFMQGSHNMIALSSVRFGANGVPTELLLGGLP